VLASKLDPAATNIAEHLLSLYEFEKYNETGNTYSCGNVILTMLSTEATCLTHLPMAVDEVVVASRHVAEAGRPSLTAHVPGKIEECRLAIASPATLWKTIRALARIKDEFKLPHEVSLEATHHGPCGLNVPVTFVEIGSKPEHWLDPKAGEAVAHAIMEACGREGNPVHAIGFGGPHYAPRHTEVALETNVAPGHIFPKYSCFNRTTIETAVARTAGGVELFVLDWKGLSAERRSICTWVAGKRGTMVARARDILHDQKFKSPTKKVGLGRD